MSDVTRILCDIEHGDPSAADQLLPLVYEELRKLAAQRMACEASDRTLQATSLVHEAYIRLVDVKSAQHFNSRGHFFAAAAEAMRRILVEDARRKRSLKRGGDKVRHELHESAVGKQAGEDILALNEALEKLVATDTDSAKLVKLRYFAGLTMDQSAETLGISTRKAHQLWAYTRSWLRHELRSD